jgi:hypothetical protein
MLSRFPLVALSMLGAAQLPGCSPSSRTPTEIEDDSWRSVQDAGITVDYKAVDAAYAPEILGHALSARTSVEFFFQRSLTGPVTVRVFPDRSSLTAYWRVAWNQPDLDPQCWMIASADNQVAVLLAPRVWSNAACGHNGANTEYVKRIVAHEIVHVLHRRVNPSPAFVGQNDLWWFVEGVAVLGSGQLDNAARSQVRAQLINGYTPSTPQSALTAQNGYNLVGSMAHYIDSRYGRDVLSDLLRAGSESELLERLGASRAQFLQSWREFVISDLP